MGEFPDDIMKTAEDTLAAAIIASRFKSDDDGIGIIARAIMAERQRCADIAWSRLPACQDTQYEDGAERATSIAQAIERGGHV